LQTNFNTQKETKKIFSTQMTSTSDKPSNSNLPSLVAVHPLVLLSVVDHFNRVAKMAKNKRVVGVLLG